ncbi:hypothetical protein [Mesorhizobium silamurunense]|uniref:hypothetical protein n=1 Tax=Mesorhizobium silamurunense TaxID=499528 RepID=UPI001FEC99A1|nr:hypothetical protein [Mesorhizobium silamurunense]
MHAHDDAIEKLDWYALRGKIETFHKILKSGCKAEEARLRTAERLVKLIAVFCILGWRVFWMTMINRSQPHAKPDLAITDVEMKLLDHLLPDKDPTASHAGTLSSYLVKIARMGGYLARASDPPPGNTVMCAALCASRTSSSAQPSEPNLRVIESLAGRVRCGSKTADYCWRQQSRLSFSMPARNGGKCQQYDRKCQRDSGSTI